MAGYVDFLIEKAIQKNMKPQIDNPRHIRANLITASPDLLAALQTIVVAIEGGDPQDIADQWNHAKATIAKATKERGEV